MDFGLNQHSGKGKGFSNVIPLWDGRLDAAMSITFLFYVVSISERRRFVCMCRELFKCCSLIQRALQCSFVAMAWHCAFNKITLYVYWAP